MTFYETLVYVLGFLAMYNLLELFSFRLQIKGEKHYARYVARTGAGASAAMTIVFVATSCFMAYRGFLGVYARNMALLATLFCAVGSVLLLRKLGLVLKFLWLEQP